MQLNFRALALSAAISMVGLSFGQGISFNDSKLFPKVDPAISHPDRVMGTSLSSRHIRSEEIVQYFAVLGQESNRVRVMEHARTHEGRPLIHAIVSSPENLAKLSQIQEIQSRLFVEPEKVTNSDLANMPAIVWMGYGVHGDESSGPEAAVMTLYRLAAGQDEWTTSVLENTVIILVPDYNPDGRNRFADYVNAFRGVQSTSHRSDLEHQVPWPGGRTNHYWFDLNRDWFPLTQPESQNRHKLWISWRPQLTLDFHEQGADSTYFFQPGVQSRVNRMTPKRNQELTLKIGAEHAKALDARKQLYFTEERYDDFYIGKGSTYPDVAGSIGILFEQAGSDGLEIETSTRVLDYRTTILNQYATSVSSLTAASEMRMDLLKYQRDFYAEKPKTSAKAIEIPVGSDPVAVDKLASLMLIHGIEVEMLARGKEQFVRVQYSQKLWRLIQAMFARQIEFDDNQFYDISAWSMDLAIGAPGREVSRLNGKSSPFVPGMTRRDLTVAKLVSPVGYRISGAHSGLFPVTGAVQRAGFATYVVTKPIAGAKPGDVFVPIREEDDSEKLIQILSSLANHFQVQVDGIEGGTGEILSLGGGSVSLIRPLSIGLVVGSGMDSNNAGEIWFLLDHEWRLPVSLIEAGNLSSSDLGRFTHIVMAGGSVNSSSQAALKSFISGGGTLIGSSSSSSAVASIAGWELKSKRYSPPLSTMAYGDIGAERARHTVPGTIFEVVFDTSHPLSFGLPVRFPVFKDSSSFVDVPSDPGTLVAKYTDEPLMAGYVSKEVAKLVPGSAAILARRMGGGKVILIEDNPNFRAFFTGPNRILGNALFYSGAF